MVHWNQWHNDGLGASLRRGRVAGAIVGNALGVPTTVGSLTRAQAWEGSSAPDGASDLIVLHASTGVGAPLVLERSCHVD
jgi:hypothetical protein